MPIASEISACETQNKGAMGGFDDFAERQAVPETADVLLDDVLSLS
jgi:hypothetical protein